MEVSYCHLINVNKIANCCTPHYLNIVDNTKKSGNNLSISFVHSSNFKMDIMKPKLQYIDGICYRINPGNNNTEFDQGSPQPYYEFDSECSGLIEPESEENFEVEQDQNGRYITKFHVPKLFFSYIIGTKGTTRKRLEGETRTNITVPKLGTFGDIVITGADRRNVCSSRNRVNMLVTSARKKQRPTHFLSVPLVHNTFQQCFKQFKKDVMETCPELDGELFQFPEALHLTLGVLKLCDNVERDQATAALENCQKTVISGLLNGRRKLIVKMQGLEYMNDDPSAVDVLYAKVSSPDEPFLLQNLANKVADFFIQKNLIEVEKNDNGVLIHATLMNSKFSSKDKSPDYEKDKSNRKMFNASRILELYKDYDFGEASISRLDLSAMHTISTSGYWTATASIDLFK